MKETDAAAQTASATLWKQCRKYRM